MSDSKFSSVDQKLEEKESSSSFRPFSIFRIFLINYEIKAFSTKNLQDIYTNLMFFSLSKDLVYFGSLRQKLTTSVSACFSSGAKNSNQNNRPISP